MRPRQPLPPPFTETAFTTQQGASAGLGRKRLQGRDLQRPFRGLRHPAVVDLTVVDLCTSLQLKLPPQSHFCGVTAAQLVGVPLPLRLEQRRILHVAVPAPHRAPAGKGIRGHQFQVDATDVREWNGLRISTPERLWCELGATLDVPDLVAAGDFLIHWRWPLTSPERLWNSLTHFRGRRGLRALHEAHPLLHDRSESRMESLLRVLVVRAGFTGLSVNLPITTSDGYRYRADLAFPDSKTILEFQSDFHRDPSRFRADMTRISRLEADGWFVIQVNVRDLDDPVELIRRIRRVLAGRPIG